MDDITIIIPTFNEEECIKNTIQSVLKLYPTISILIADEGSKDRTREIVKELNKENNKVNLLDREKDPIHGITASVIDAALKITTPYFIVIDGDLQHPPEKIKEFQEKFNQGADIVVGARPSLPKEWSNFRKLQSNIANYLAIFRLYLTGCPSEDPISGFFWW